jgi:hypothetical protein
MMSAANLGRAYRWLLSNPEAAYKSYFRDVYTAYASASDYNLVRLRRLLGRRAFEPAHATKVYLPKPSGLLRTYTLLSVEDQIVYQACVNIVAEKLVPKVRGRYHKTIFGHLYAGKSSPFFYRKWQDGYRAYSKRVVEAVEGGENFVANFDLTAFYDSIDHEVLRHFLHDIAVEDDLIDFLLRCLRVWTSSTWPQAQPIYLGHGIPQGPLPSGLLAEVLLKYLDDKGIRGGARYLRYVDDIKLFARTESQLRRRLVSLDLASKDIGLFPQSSKVAISKVKDPREEIKTVSNPPEPALRGSDNQPRLRKRLLELTQRATVKDATRFKFLLARAMPSAALNGRLMQVLAKQPEFSVPVSNYVRRYEKVPKRFGEILVEYVRTQEIYHSASAEVLRSMLGNLQGRSRRDCADLCYSRLFNPLKGTAPPQPSLRSALWAWVLAEHRARYSQYIYALRNERDSWVVKEMISSLPSDTFGTPSMQAVLNWAICAGHADAARCAARRIVEDNFEVGPKIEEISHAARPILFAGGRIRRIGRPESLVHEVLCKVLHASFARFNWRAFLSGDHTLAEALAFGVRGYFESSIDSGVLALDSLCDLIFDSVWREVKPPTKTRPNYGSALVDPDCVRRVPDVCHGFKALHDLRITSSTAHPRGKKTGTPSRRLKHRDWRPVEPAMRAAITQLVATL